MRILVTGSRDWKNWREVYRVLNDVCDEFDLNYASDDHGNTLPDPSKLKVVHGACPTGADHWVDQWAVSNCNLGLSEPHPADWSLGRSAGPKRNAEMVALGADLCLAFIGPCTSPRCSIEEPHDSHGASGCADLAERAGIPTRRFVA